MTTKTETVPGRDLRVGDMIAVWWRPGHDVITGLRPYAGRGAGLFPEGARIATFGICRTGMTIDNAEVYARVVAMEADADDP